MADSSGPQPGYRPLTEGEKAVQAEQGRALVGDLKAILRVNAERPFTTLRDAAQQLLPFHVRARACKRGAGRPWRDVCGCALAGARAARVWRMGVRARAWGACRRRRSPFPHRCACASVIFPVRCGWPRPLRGPHPR
jgi:hypothetical protein